MCTVLTNIQSNCSISPDCGYLSTYTGDIYNSYYHGCNVVDKYVAGQLFDTTDYAVLVQAQNC